MATCQSSVSATNLPIEVTKTIATGKRADTRPRWQAKFAAGTAARGVYVTAHGEQCARDRAQDNARDKQYLEVGRQRHDQVAEHKDNAVAHEQLVAAEPPRAEREHRRGDSVDQREHADELTRGGKRYAEFRCQVAFDTDDHELGAAERESQQHEQRQAELGCARGESAAAVDLLLGVVAAVKVVTPMSHE